MRFYCRLPGGTSSPRFRFDFVHDSSQGVQWDPHSAFCCCSSGSHSWAWKLFHHAHRLPQGAVLGLQVVDPRRVRVEGEGGMGEQEEIMASSAALPSDATSLWTAFTESGQVAFADCPSLWSPREAPSTELPVADVVLCERRRQRQLALTRGDPVGDEEEHMVSVMLIKRASAGHG